MYVQSKGERLREAEWHLLSACMRVRVYVGVHAHAHLTGTVTCRYPHLLGILGGGSSQCAPMTKCMGVSLNAGHGAQAGGLQCI